MNRKGFVLVETLVVTIFTLFTFTILYNSAVPLLGKYQELSYYDDLATTYDLYHIKKLIENDLKSSEILNNHYKKITCNSEIFDNVDACDGMFSLFEIDSLDEVWFLNTNYISEFKNDPNVSDDVKNYLKYIKPKGNIVILQNDGYISYLNLNKSSGKIKDYITDSITNSSCNSTITDTDGTVYLSGDNDCVNFNYVWYSGKLWRITSINPDGTMKMVTDELITAINWGYEGTRSETDTSSAYDVSYVRQWLNQEFLLTLYNYDKILEVDTTWDITTDLNYPPSPSLTKTLINDPVGLLTNYEYYMSYQNTTSENAYLNNGYKWWLMTPYNHTLVNIVSTNGSLDKFDSSLGTMGIRPAVKLLANTQITSGYGTSSNPYTLKNDNSEVVYTDTLLNTRSSGEYVIYKKDPEKRVFRIVSNELIDGELTTRLIANDYVKDTYDLDLDGDTNEVLKKCYLTDHIVGVSPMDNTLSDECWNDYLYDTWLKGFDSSYNETYYSSYILASGWYYFGLYNQYGSYKMTVCRSEDYQKTINDCIYNYEVVPDNGPGFVGFSRVGEMFATQPSNIDSSKLQDFWLMTPNSFNDSGPSINFVLANGEFGVSENPNTDLMALRPIINMKSDLIIMGGKGTLKSPYIIDQLPR